MAELLRSTDTDPLLIAVVLALAFPPPMKTVRFCANCLAGVQADDLRLAIDFRKHALNS